jgi:hypothetical protein
MLDRRAMVYLCLTESLKRVDEEKALKTFFDLANKELSINGHVKIVEARFFIDDKKNSKVNLLSY